MFWEPSTPWFPRGISRLLLPQKVMLKWVKPAHLCPHLLVLLLLSSKLKQICGVSLPVWAAVALYRRMKRSRRCISRDLQLSARRSLFFCSILPTLEQQQPPWRCSQPITCSGQLIFPSTMALSSSSASPSHLLCPPSHLSFFSVSSSYCSSPVHLSLWHSTLTQRACM